MGANILARRTAAFLSPACRRLALNPTWCPCWSDHRHEPSLPAAARLDFAVSEFARQHHSFARRGVARQVHSFWILQTFLPIGDMKIGNEAWSGHSGVTTPACGTRFRSRAQTASQPALSSWLPPRVFTTTAVIRRTRSRGPNLIECVRISKTRTR